MCEAKKFSVFEYRKARALAQANKADEQQKVMLALMRLGYGRQWAEEAAENGQDLRPVNELTEQEAKHINKMMDKIREYDMDIYKAESMVII